MKKKLSLMMIALLGMIGLVYAAAYQPTEATETIYLTKASVEAADYMSVTKTDKWTGSKTYAGVTGEFYNMSSTDRLMDITVKGVSKFEVFVYNTNANRSYNVTVGSGAAQTIAHTGSGLESSGEIETGTTDEVTITLGGTGASVYPVKIVLTKAEDGQQPGDDPEPTTSTFRDIKLDLTQHPELLTGDDVLITVADDGTIGTTDNQEEAAALVNGHVHNSYGSSNFTAIVPVEGTVKITYATHDYGNDITVTDDNGTEVAKLNTQGAKWMNDHTNVVVAYYRTNEPTTLHFSNANYNPYFAVEAIDPADIPAEVTKYTVTFAAGEADGVAPAPVEVEAGNKITAPKNYTLYAANKTLTGWSDGTTTYAVGEEITPTADMTLTAQYTPNEVSLADRTEAVTISCDLSGYNDAPKYNFQNNTGIIVTQATVGGKAIDVRIDVDATSGKFAHNGSGWHQVNTGTKVSVPSCKGATFSVKTYQNANALKFGETAATAEADPATYTATADDAALVIEQTANGYWNQLTITLPVVQEEVAKMYLLGNMNDWNRTAMTEMAYNAEKGVYEYQWNAGGFAEGKSYFAVATKQLTEDEDAADADWSTFNANYRWAYAEGDQNVTLDTEVQLVKGNGTIVLTEPGTYNLTLTKDMKLTVSKAGAAEDVYVVAGWLKETEDAGFFGEKWNGTLEANKLEKQADGTYAKTWTAAELPVGTIEYKIVKNGSTWIPEGDNLFATVETAGKYDVTVVFNAETQEASMTLAAGEEPGDDTQEAVFASWDFGNANVMNETMALSGTTTPGEVNSVEQTLKMTVEANGATFRNNGNNIQVRTGAVFKIPVRSAGDEVFVSGYPSYSYYTIGDDETELTGDNTYTAKTADARRGYVAVTSTNDNNYYYKLTVNQKAITGEANMVEKALYVTDFTEWPTINRKTATDETHTVTTLYSQEQLTFTLTGIGVEPEGNNAKFSQYTGYMISAKNSEYTAGDVVGTTSPLNNITKVVFTQAATGGNRGWKVSVKGDGDEDWVVLHNQSIATQGGETITLNVNRKNAQLKFENFTASQNAYMVDLKIYGEVDLSNAPLLGSFKYDGTTYTGEQFDMTASGNYEATFELFSTQQLPGANKPITEVTPDNGEVGEITYAETDLQSVVTIPVTAKGQTVNYVATFIYKPMLTMTYIDQNGEEIGTQQIEKDTEIGQFQYNIDDVASTRDGYKARGWFKQNYQGEKWLTTSVVSEDIKLYAYETEIEEASLSRKYEFDLTDKFFYAEDHEAFNPEGTGKYYNNHGWVFGNGDKIDLLVGPKANIVIGLCAYSKEGATIEASNGTTINAKSETDGATEAIEYEGEGGTLTLTINSTGAVYIHSIKIFNTSETNYEKQGQWIVVKPGDVSSFLDALDAANGAAGDERVYIFLPDGEYDLGTAVLTEITRSNVSLIGQSRDGVIIKNAPPTSLEGLGKADLLLNTSTGLYLQDLTLKNGLDYYSAGSAGRAPTLHDKGTKTINKNVRHLSYQDTYYSHQTGGLYYFEGGEIHGTVDYLCGNGKAYFNEVSLVNERHSNATMTANSELYVLNNCTVKASDATAFNFGRAWSDNPVCIWLNTTLEEPDKLISTRWNLSGINCDFSIAGEYGTKNADGEDITPESNVVTFTKANTELNTILTEEQAAQYTIDYVLGDWAAEAQEACQQLEPPVAVLNEGTITWEAVDGASAYAIFRNEIFVGLTTETSFTMVSDVAAPALEESEPDIYTIRVANAHGGLGNPMVVMDNASGIRQLTPDTQKPATIYDLQGRRVNTTTKGVYIVNGKKVVVK